MASRHVIKAQQFDREGLERLFSTADQLQRAVPRHSGLLRERIMATLFYEPSTRTRLSFEAAMVRLGGSVIATENAREFSSAAKGESLEDTIRVIGGYADVIVLRHYEEGAAERAAAVSDVPVINAGDGAGQHPTQALLDLYTIKKELGSVDGLTIAFVGDLAHGRTVRSLAYLLGKFSPRKVIFVAPEVVRMRQDIKDYLVRRGVPFEERDDLHAVASEADVVYQTRIQKERFGDRLEEYRSASGRYVVDRSVLDRMGPRSIVMHPLPRLSELAVEADADPRAAYFRQARYGLPVRMALLATVLS